MDCASLKGKLKYKKGRNATVMERVSTLNAEHMNFNRRDSLLTSDTLHDCRVSAFRILQAEK
jgi:hypothetical protein